MRTFLEIYASGFWPWLGITIGLGLLVDGLRAMFNRWLRSRNIARHGWPTNPLMDADGDIIHPPPPTPTR
jgi:hypothetical protein